MILPRTLTPDRVRRKRRLRSQILQVFLLALVSCLPAPASAQKHYLFDHLSVKDGLSQGSVFCMLQDRKGFMWFGTQDGLNRYDGHAVTIYRRDPANPKSLSENFVTSLYEDVRGTLWIGTEGDEKYLNRYDAAAETFSRIARDSVDLRGAAISKARTTYEDPSGVLWSGTITSGMTRFDPKTGVKTIFTHDPGKPGSLIDNSVYSVYGDRNGTIWVGTKGGLERFDRETDTFVHYRHDERNPTSIGNNWVWPIFEDQSGVMWVGTYGGGLYRFDRATGVFTPYRHSESDPRSLSDDQLYSIYQDRSGMIWVGTSDHGVDRFHPGMGAFSHYTRDPKDPASLGDAMIKSIYVDHAGTPWIGTASGLDRFDRAKGTFAHFTHDPGRPATIAVNAVQTILEDRSGALWLGMMSSGLDRFDRNTGTFTHFVRDAIKPGSLTDNRIYALLEDRDGELWIGTYGGGLNKYDAKTRTFTAYTRNDSIPGRLSGRGVWALCEDGDGAIWVGTSGGGLNRFDKKQGKFAWFRHGDDNPGSLSDNFVTSIMLDRSGTLWVGTFAGLNKYDRERETFRHYREKEGLANDLILGILEDGRGMLWISTNKGLSRFDPTTEKFRNFSQRDGLQGDEFNQNAYARNPVTGQLYFGGGNGFNEFHPDSVRDNRFVPPVVFSGFTRYNTDDAEGKPIEEKGISTRPHITLSYKDNVATFSFAALNYLNPSMNRYAYRLVGYNDNWIQLGGERQATFTNLDGGEYTLQVKGSNNDGIWNDEGASLGITVTPPWWKTRLAYALYAVIVIGILYTLRRFELNRREQKTAIREAELRSKAMEAEKRALEAENERKTKELEDARLLQLSMLPRAVPEVPGYQISVFMKTATEVGGDYYDFAVDPNGALNVAFGDATGHGMQAGTIVTLMKGLFMSNATRFDLQAFFAHCNASIREIHLTRLYMALTLVRLKGNSLSFTCAGMPPVFIYRKATGAVEEVLLSGMPLGAMKKYPYGLHETELGRGDTVLLITDGLPEQKNDSGEMFDYARVQGLLAQSGEDHPDEMIKRLTAAGDAFMEGALQDDDFTMLVIKRKE